MLRYFVTFIALVCLAFLTNTVTAQVNCFPVGKPGANKTYIEKSDKCERCESAENAKCFDITGKDARAWKPGTEEVEDKDRPIFRPILNSSVLQSCENSEDCRDQAKDPNGDGQFDDRVCIDDNKANERWDELANHPDIESGTDLKGPWFIWCSKRTGFEMKTIDVLKPDPQGQEQVEREKQKREQARQRRQNARAEIVNCRENVDSLSQAELNECIKALLRSK